jgi:hypothetical protein
MQDSIINLKKLDKNIVGIIFKSNTNWWSSNKQDE